MKKKIIIALVVAMNVGGIIAAKAAAPPDDGAPATAATPRNPGHPEAAPDEEPCGSRQQHGDHRGRRHHPFAKLAAELGLSDRQKTQIQEIFAKSRPAAKPLRTKLITEKRALTVLIRSGAADESAIRSQAAKVAGLEADLAVQRAQTARQVRSLLTPDQIAKFKAGQEKRERRLDEFREHREERFERPDSEE